MGWLVLSRHEGESLIFTDGDKIVEVQVAEIRGNRVNLAINAPAEIHVRRNELPERAASDAAQE